jgi:hypothetical protein
MKPQSTNARNMATINTRQTDLEQVKGGSDGRSKWIREKSEIWRKAKWWKWEGEKRKKRK